MSDGVGADTINHCHSAPEFNCWMFSSMTLLSNIDKNPPPPARSSFVEGVETWTQGQFSRFSRCRVTKNPRKYSSQENFCCDSFSSCSDREATFWSTLIRFPSTPLILFRPYLFHFCASSKTSKVLTSKRYRQEKYRPDVTGAGNTGRGYGRLLTGWTQLAAMRACVTTRFSWK